MAGAIQFRVVLADDNAGMRDYAGRLLNRAGFEVVTAPDGKRRSLDDITARKEAAIELAESRSRLSGVVESAMDAIISIDPRQNVVLFNSAAESMFQRKAADVLGRPLDQLLPQRFAKRHAQHVDAFAQTGVSNRTMGSLGVLRALRADDSELPIEASISQTSRAKSSSPQ